MEARVKIVKFFNYSSEPFTRTWDNVPYTFQPNETVNLPDFQARNFAKHLAMRTWFATHQGENKRLSRTLEELQPLIERALPKDSADEPAPAPVSQDLPAEEPKPEVPEEPAEPLAEFEEKPVDEADSENVVIPEVKIKPKDKK